jgi:hypothetical protein
MSSVYARHVLIEGNIARVESAWNQAPGTQRLTLEYGEASSRFANNLKLRRYSTANKEKVMPALEAEQQAIMKKHGNNIDFDVLAGQRS